MKHKDAVAGLFFVLVGLGAIIIAWDYRFGTARSMGPGYFPTVLGGMIAGLGLIQVATAIVKPSSSSNLGAWALRPLVAVLAAILAFAFLIRPVGLVLAVVAVVGIARLAEPKFRVGDTVVISGVLIAISTAVFFYGLGIPMRLLPWQ